MEILEFERKMPLLYKKRLGFILKDTKPGTPLSSQNIGDIEEFLEDLVSINNDYRWAFDLFEDIERVLDICSYPFYLSWEVESIVAQMQALMNSTCNLSDSHITLRDKLEKHFEQC